MIIWYEYYMIVAMAVWILHMILWSDESTRHVLLRGALWPLLIIAILFNKPKTR